MIYIGGIYQANPGTKTTLLMSPKLLESQTITTPLILLNKLIFTIHFSICYSRFLLLTIALGDTPIFSTLSSITLKSHLVLSC